MEKVVRWVLIAALVGLFLGIGVGSVLLHKGYFS